MAGERRLSGQPSPGTFAVAFSSVWRVTAHPAAVFLLALGLIATRLMLILPWRDLGASLPAWFLFDERPHAELALLAAGLIAATALLISLTGAALGLLHGGLDGAALALTRTAAIATSALLAGTAIAGSLFALGAISYRAISWATGNESTLGSLAILALGALPSLAVAGILSAAGLLAVARQAAGDEPGAMPWAGARALGRAVSDLLASPLRSSELTSALALSAAPLLLLGLLAALLYGSTAPVAARLALIAVQALCWAVVLLAFAAGLRQGICRRGTDENLST